jgi:hypothetical protein
VYFSRGNPASQSHYLQLAPAPNSRGLTFACVVSASSVIVCAKESCCNEGVGGGEGRTKTRMRQKKEHDNASARAGTSFAIKTLYFMCTLEQ